MANDKKMVEAITSMDEDFAQWYTDVVLKAGLIAYTNVKDVWLSSLQDMQSGSLYRSSLMRDLRQQVWRMCTCLC